MAYNGWSNRETWLVNLWFEEWFEQYKRDGFELTPQFIKSTIEEYVDSFEIGSSFITDMINLSGIDWNQLSEAYKDI